MDVDKVEALWGGKGMAFVGNLGRKLLADPSLEQLSTGFWHS